MTRTDQPSAEQPSATPVRPPSRRELRKQWLAESGESDKKPTSIFDLPFVPRRKYFAVEEQPDDVVEPVAELDPQDLGIEHDEPYEEVPKPIRAKQASQAVQADALPALLPEAERPDPTAAAPIIEPAPKPAATPKPAVTPEPKPAVTAKVEPTNTALKPPVVIQPTITPATGALLFERIPEPEPSTRTDTFVSDGVEIDAPELQGNDDTTETSKHPRRRVAAVFGAVAAFGMVATMALPAFGPSGEVPASAEEFQVLFEQGSTRPLIDIESFESLDELEAAAEAATLGAGSFVNNPDAPVQYPFSTGVPLTDGFGPRAFPVAGFHDAQDFAAGYGAAVRAIASGKVVESGPTSDGCGFGLKISHRIDGQNVMSRYCHLATAPVVNVGQNVRAGEFVALVGNSGMSYGPHLHLVIEVDGAAVDPMPFLEKYNKPRNQW